MTKLRHWVAFAILIGLWACGSPEQSTLQQFFRAAETNDTVTVASMSAVSPPFELESWAIGEVTSRTTEPFDLPELHKKFKDAEAEREAGQEQRKEYFEEHEDELSQIIPKLREDPEYQFRGRLGEIQQEWTAMLDERKETERVYQEAKRAVDAATRLASKSVVRQVSLVEFEGDVNVTEMLLNLKPEGGEELPFKATLRKYDVTDPEMGRIEPARWVIADLEGATPEARAAAEAASGRGPLSSASAEPSEGSEGEREPSSQSSSRAEPTHVAQELRGEGRVQILNPETRVEGDEAITTIHARNISTGWIVGFTVTEHWFDEEGNPVSSSSTTYRSRFMPQEVIEIELKTRKSPEFYQNQFEFSHANGDVRTSVVPKFPT